MGRKWKLILPLALLVLLLCTVCASAACSHKWELEGVVGGTCQSPAMATYRCTKCKETKKEAVGKVDPNNHIGWEFVGVIGGNCKTPDQEIYRCILCGYTEYRPVGTVNPNNHDTEVVTKKAVAPTCTSRGYTAEIRCGTCGMILQPQIPIQPLAHSGKTIRAAKAATCTQDGWTAQVVCKYCGITLSVSTPIPKLGHSIKTKSVGTNLLQDYCERCGMKFGNVYIDPKATPKNFGATNMSNGIKLSWNKVVNANAGYTIWRNGKIIATGITALNYTDKTAVNGTKYTYKICAEYEGSSADGTAYWSNRTNQVSKVWVFVSRPSSASGSRTKVTSAKVTGATGYRIQVINASSKIVYDKTAAANSRTVSLPTGTLRIRARAYRTVDGVKYWSAYTPYYTFTSSASGIVTQ